MKILPVILMAVLSVLAIYILLAYDISVDDILSYTPSSVILSAILIIFLFALKSLSVFFPILLLYACVGSIYPWYTALLINFLGLFVTLSLPYVIGRCSGKELTERLQEKYKAVARVTEGISGAELYNAFFLRVINILPADIVSMLMGSMRFHFKPFIIGSIIGSLPAMVATTIMGATLTDPTSPAFIASASFIVVISIVSYMIHRHRTKKSSDE